MCMLEFSNILQNFFQRNKAKNSVYKWKWNAKKIDSNHPREDRKEDKEEQEMEEHGENKL